MENKRTKEEVESSDEEERAGGKRQRIKSESEDDSTQEPSNVPSSSNTGQTQGMDQAKIGGKKPKQHSLAQFGFDIPSRVAVPSAQGSAGASTSTLVNRVAPKFIPAVSKAKGKPSKKPRNDSAMAVFQKKGRDWDSTAIKDKWILIKKIYYCLNSRKIGGVMGVCNFSNPLYAQLVTHLAIHQTDRPFICPTCSNTFKSQYSLNKHVASNHSEKEMNCTSPGCDYVSKWSSNLARHFISKHTGTKPYKCSDPNCTSAFNDPSARDKHEMAKHTSQRFFCHIACCEEKAFTQRSNLTRHQKTTKLHGAVGDFQCPACSHCFTQLVHLSKHIEGPKTCKVPGCSFELRCVGEMTSHFKDQHPIKYLHYKTYLQLAQRIGKESEEPCLALLRVHFKGILPFFDDSDIVNTSEMSVHIGFEIRSGPKKGQNIIKPDGILHVRDSDGKRNGTLWTIEIKTVLSEFDKEAEDSIKSGRVWPDGTQFEGGKRWVTDQNPHSDQVLIHTKVKPRGMPVTQGLLVLYNGGPDGEGCNAISFLDSSRDWTKGRWASLGGTN